MTENLRVVGQIVALVPVVVAIIVLRIFFPLVIALKGRDTALSWALRLNARLDQMEASWR